jgi:PST family polysaccharide transporter
MVLLSRLLPPTDFGYLAMIMAVIGIANVLGDFGLSLAAIQAKRLTDAQKTNLFWLNTLIGAVLAAATWSLASPIATAFGEPLLAEATRVLAVVFLANGVMAQFRVELSRRLRFRVLALGEVASQAVALLLAVGAALVGAGYWSLVIQQVAIPMTLLLTYVFASSWKPGRRQRNAPVRPFIGFSLSTTAVQLVNYLSSNVHSVAIGHGMGATDLGLFTRGFQIFMLPLQQIASPLTRVMLPVLSQRVGTPDYARYLMRIQTVLAYSVGSALTYLAIAGKPVIVVGLGERWEASGVVVQILAVGGIFQALGYLYYWIFLSSARMQVLLISEVVGRAFLISFVVLAAPHGLAAVATGYSAGLLAIWLITTCFGLPRVKGIGARGLLGVTGRSGLIFAVTIGGGLLLAPQIRELDNFLQAILFLCLEMSVLAAATALPSVRGDYRAIVNTVRRMT